jgi:putative tryptophan/tyrosine transport system substrate-binding protein
MRRREFVALLGVAAAWPLAARAQQSAMPVIGLLNGQTSAASTALIAAFRQGLAAAGFVEGRNLAIVYRSAEGDIGQLPALAAELVRLPVAVIAAVGGDNSVRFAKAATATIPIVFTTGTDPVETGIVASLSRPGGNVTGASFMGSLVAAKQIGLLRDTAPRLATIGLLVDPLNPMVPAIIRDVQTAAQGAGLKAVAVEVNGERDIDAALAQFVEQRVDALIVTASVPFLQQRDRLITLAARHAIPAIYFNRDFPSGGGLMSYGADLRDAYRQAGVYVGRILKGDKPADLPVTLPTRFELVINMKTVKALGLSVPPGLIAIADEVIE